MAAHSQTTAPPDIAQAINELRARSAAAAGSSGFIENTSGAPVTIALPSDPVVNQTVLVKDAAGNAGTYPITIIAAPYLIEGMPSLILQYNYSWARLAFSGVQWLQI